MRARRERLFENLNYDAAREKIKFRVGSQRNI